METKELMPGDLVMSFGKVTGVWMVDASHEDEEDQLINYLDASEFEPIPLTIEILDKNGFGFVDTSNDEYSSVWTGWWILEGLELGCCDNSKFPVFFNIADTNVKVNYVHELQHALKICGIEKDIVL